MSPPVQRAELALALPASTAQRAVPIDLDQDSFNNSAAHENPRSCKNARQRLGLRQPSAAFAS
jgi:hypothetical protein